MEFGVTSIAVAVNADVVASCLPPATHAVVEMEGDALAYVSALIDVFSFVFGSGTGDSRNDTVVPHVAPLVPALQD